MRHIGNRHPQDIAARIAWVFIGMGMDGVIPVAGIHRVDGHQRQMAQVFAVAQRRGFGAVGLGDHRIGELVGDAVLMDGNQADGARPGGIAQPFDDPRRGQAHAFGPSLFGLHQLAIAGLHGQACGHTPFRHAALVDRHDPPALVAGAEDAQHADGIDPQLADHPRLIGEILALHRGQLGQNPVSLAQGRIARPRQQMHARGIRLALPFRRFGKQIACRIRLQHPQDADRGQGARFTEIPLAPGDGALQLQLFQQAFQFDTLGAALDGKSLGNIALRRERGVLGDPLADLIF